MTQEVIIARLEWPIKDFKNTLNATGKEEHFSPIFTTTSKSPYPVTWRMIFWPNGDIKEKYEIPTIGLQLTSNHSIKVKIEKLYVIDKTGAKVFLEEFKDEYIIFAKAYAKDTWRVSWKEIIKGVKNDGSLTIIFEMSYLIKE